jgi:hypothetical protein
VFIDETWCSTNMARTRGRAPKGERLRASVPHGHWKTTTFVAGLRLDGMVAPLVLDGPINGEAFQAYVDQVLLPNLAPGDIGHYIDAAFVEQCEREFGRGAVVPGQRLTAAFSSLRARELV